MSENSGEFRPFANKVETHSISVGEARIYDFPERKFKVSDELVTESNGQVHITTPSFSEETISGKIVNTPSNQKIIIHKESPNELGYSFVHGVFHLGKRPSREEALHEYSHKEYFSLPPEQQIEINNIFLSDPELKKALLTFADHFYSDKGLGYIPLHFINWIEKSPELTNTIFTSLSNEPGVKDNRVIRINDTNSGLKREVVLSLLVSELISHMSAAKLNVESQYLGPADQFAAQVWSIVNRNPELYRQINSRIFSVIENGKVDELIISFDVS